METIIAALSVKFRRAEREASRLARVLDERRGREAWTGQAWTSFERTMGRKRRKALQAAAEYALAIEALRAVKEPVVGRLGI